MKIDGNSIRMSMPFAKVDESKRTVSGFATLDNIDTQSDVVLSEASVNAFTRARGNLREMHQPVAVGKVIDFQEEEFYDSQNDELYRGIFVTARVSEGAEDTWIKVLDGTLTGFSIGGEINEASNEFVKEANKTIRFIKDYDLVELSLVDNPANQLANIVSFQKSQTGSVTVKMGDASTTRIESVFVCPDDHSVIVKDSEQATCPECDTLMDNAGWFESTGDRREKVRDIVSKFLDPTEKEAAPSDNEGGVEMGKKDEVAKAAEEVVEEEVTHEAETEEEVEPAEVDEVVDIEEDEEDIDPDEVQDDSAAVSKKIEELLDVVKGSLKESKEETLEKVSELEKKVDDAAKSFTDKASELEKKIDEFGEKLETAKARLITLENGLEKVNASEAIKKSAEVESTPAVRDVQDTSWNGAFSGDSSKFSVDNLM